MKPFPLRKLVTPLSISMQKPKPLLARINKDKSRNLLVLRYLIGSETQPRLESVIFWPPDWPSRPVHDDPFRFGPGRTILKFGIRLLDLVQRVVGGPPARGGWDQTTDTTGLKWSSSFIRGPVPGPGGQKSNTDPFVFYCNQIFRRFH